MTENRFAMVSEWMANGNINEFIVAHPDANRFELVSRQFRFLVSLITDDNPNSWQTLRGAWSICTLRE